MKRFLLFFALTILIFSCKRDHSAMSEEMGYFSRADDDIKFKMNSDEIAVTERKLIKQGSISFETNNPSKTYNAIIKLVNQNKGFIASDNENKTDWRYTRNITIRLPKDQFDVFIHDLTSAVGSLESKNINIKDVTEEFIDLESRLKAKQTLEKRYLELITEAKNVEEVLLVEKELGTLQADIESMQGRLKYLSNKVDLSTLEISYYQTINQDIVKDNEILKSLKSGWYLLRGLFLMLLSLWPVLALGVILFYLLKKYRKRKSKKDN